MRAFASLLAISLLSVAGSLAASESPAAPAVEATALSEAETVVAEVELAVQMAQDGQYGRIKPRDMATLERAQDQVIELLSQVDTLAELGPEQRSLVADARTQIGSILNVEDKDRRVCKRVSATGTRLGAMECLTVAERELRARASREMAGSLQRGFCIPGQEGVSACSN